MYCRLGRLVTMYGSTAATDENISCQDICIFYHRVTGNTIVNSILREDCLFKKKERIDYLLQNLIVLSLKPDIVLILQTMYATN